jgi:5-methylcytosine-specific restriction protein A
MPMTPVQLEALEKIASEVYDGLLKNSEGAEYLAQHYGINQGSARMYIDNYKNLLDGKIVKSGMRIAVVDFFLTKIFEKRGRLTHGQALEALELHIEYHQEHNKKAMHSMQAVLDEQLSKHY